LARWSATQVSVPFLDQACTNDFSLRQEVESLLSKHDSSDPMLDKTVGALAAKLLTPDQTESLVGRTVGAYKIEREIGRGGMEKFSLRATPDWTDQSQSSFFPLPLRTTVIAYAGFSRRREQPLHSITLTS
jgi:hypothetical protein